MVIECSVRPVAHVAIDPDDPRLDALLDALIGDDRALGAWCLGHADGTLESTFQGAVPGDGAIVHAAAAATGILNDAFAAAGIDARCDGCSVVEGDDPDLLP
jgi:hypothetical protein